MAFFTEEIKQEKFEKLDDVKNWAAESNKNLIRVPIQDFFNSYSNFFDDEYFGDVESLFRFNRNGFQSFCSILGVRTDLLNLIASPNLTSIFLNDLISQSQIREKFKGYEFVIDNNERLILGVVSSTYLGYSNEKFINDIFRLPSISSFSLLNAYSINTELILILNSETYHGEIKGKGGVGLDRTVFGLVFKNSMVGTSSVSINYHLFRLLCSNGMMVPAAQSVNRVYHSGRNESFEERLKRSFNDVSRKLGMLDNFLKSLNGLVFDPEKLAYDTFLIDKIFEVIPRSKQELSQNYNAYLKYPIGASEALRIEKKREHNAFLLSRIPFFYGGEHASKVFTSDWRNNSTIFDFLNVFTEYAKEKPLKAKVEIEEKTGALANYIHHNAKKFN